MATWSDKRLSNHKRAQGYVNSASATLGVTALGAMALKSKKVGSLAARRAPKLDKVRSKTANATVPLSIGATGVGGIGGYNMAAIQSQEAKKTRVRKMDSKQRRQTRDALAGTSVGSAVAGVGAARIEGSQRSKQHQAHRRYVRPELYTNEKAFEPTKANVKADAAKTYLKAGRRMKAAGRASMGLAVGAIGTGVASEAFKPKKPVRKALSPDVAASPFAKAMPAPTPGKPKQAAKPGLKPTPLATGMKTFDSALAGKPIGIKSARPAAPAAGGAGMSMRSPSMMQPAGQQKPQQPQAQKIMKSDWKNITERQRRARDARRGKRTSATVAGAGGALLGLGLSTPEYRSQTKTAAHGFKHAAKTRDLAHAGRVAVKNPIGTAALGGAAAAAGAIGAGFAEGAREKHHDRKIAQLRRKRAVSKGFDPERSRMKRLEGYEKGAKAGAVAGAGAAGVGAAFTLGSAVKARNVHALKRSVRGNKKAMAIGAGAAAAGHYGGKAIERHRKGKGQPWRALPLT